MSLIPVSGDSGYRRRVSIFNKQQEHIQHFVEQRAELTFQFVSHAPAVVGHGRLKLSVERR